MLNMYRKRQGVFPVAFLFFKRYNYDADIFDRLFGGLKR